MALEGTHPALTFERANSVTYETVISASVKDVRKQLAKTPTLDSPRSFITRLFPAPKISGYGLAVGDVRRFDFAYNMWLFTNYREDHVSFKVAHASNDKVRFELQEDESYLKKYIGWKSADIELKAVDATHTKVTTTIHFHRILDPAWYVQPLQRYYVGQAAKVLTETLSSNS